MIGFVSNGGWIDGNTADGIRLTLPDEFHHIYIYNLRGNTRTSGEQARKEGGQTFGQGSRNTIAITLLVKQPDPVPDGGAGVVAGEENGVHGVVFFGEDSGAVRRGTGSRPTAGTTRRAARKAASRCSMRPMSLTATTQPSQPPPSAERARTAWPKGALSDAGWSSTSTISR